MTFANNCFIICLEFVEIGSGIYEKRIDTNANESYQNKIECSIRRELAKTNYRIHTDSIKDNLVPTLTEKQKLYVYANEADILNVALFGMTAKEWSTNNPNLDGNIRDFATMNELICLANLENLNYVFNQTQVYTYQFACLYNSL